MSNTITVSPVIDFEKIKKIAETGSLYVINNVDQQNSRSRGVLVIDIKGDDNETFGITIPDTWLPYNLASQCEPILYLKSNIFRNMISKKHLVVIETESALNLLNSQAAQDEQKRIDEFLRANAAALANTMSSYSSTPTNDGGLKISLGGGYVDNSQPQTEEAFAPDDNEIHRLAADFNGGKLSDVEAIQALNTLKPSLDALKEVAGTINNTGSGFYSRITDLISDAAPSQGAYKGPKPPPGFGPQR